MQDVDLATPGSKVRLMARLPVDKYTFPWGDADKCPCGSGSIFVKCCKARSGYLPYVKIPDLTPPGEVTGHAHPKCYMSRTNNCSKGKSREHYISEAILERFDKLNVSGMPWQKKGETRVVPAKSLAAKILCERHNNALAPIDTLGLRAFDALTWAADYAVTQRHPGRAKHYLISGEGLELWLFKLAAGIHFGGVAAAEGGVVRDKGHVDDARIGQIELRFALGPALHHRRARERSLDGRHFGRGVRVNVDCHENLASRSR